MDLRRFYSVTVETLHTGCPTGEQLAVARKLLMQPGRFIAAELEVRGTTIRFVCDLEAAGEIDASANALGWLRQALGAPDVGWDAYLARTRVEVVRLTEQRNMAFVVQERALPGRVAPQMLPQQEYAAAAA
jgi:hypothetical protein